MKLSSLMVRFHKLCCYVGISLMSHFRLNRKSSVTHFIWIFDKMILMELVFNNTCIRSFWSLKYFQINKSDIFCHAMCLQKRYFHSTTQIWWPYARDKELLLRYLIIPLTSDFSIAVKTTFRDSIMLKCCLWLRYQPSASMLKHMIMIKVRISTINIIFTIFYRVFLVDVQWTSESCNKLEVLCSRKCI